MSYHYVFIVLSAKFPQVDQRLLKAAAIEHSDDVEAAMAFITNEVLPSLCISPKACDRDNTDHLSVNTESEEPTSPVKHQESELTGSHQGSHVLSESMKLDDIFFECNNIPPENSLDLINAKQMLTNLASETLPTTYSSHLGESSGLVNCVSHGPEEAQGHGINLDTNCLDGHFTNLSRETLDVSTANEMEDVSVQLDSSHITQEYVADATTSRTSYTNDTVSEKLTQDTKQADYEDGCFSKSKDNQSSQICRVEVLEDAIAEAKNNKKTLFTTMDSVILMMREVEDLEKAAEQAKEAAFRGGLDIHTKVEDLRKMLLRANEANDMHAGEVYGEKAILASEASELQSRLQNLSYERDRSLSILNEMRQALEARMAAAEEVRKTAEQDKLNKESSAQKALTEQELIMEQVVQDSKRLCNQAEENSKLCEFLTDRGRIVDTLQGEMAVICKDVELLKEKFENQVPVDKILSSSQTSCILASSGSSGKSLAPNSVPEQDNASEVLSSSQTSCIMSSSGSSDKSLAPNLVPQQVDKSESPKMTSSPSLTTDNSWENGMSKWKEFAYKEPTNDDDWNFIEADVVG